MQSPNKIVEKLIGLMTRYSSRKLFVFLLVLGIIFKLAMEKMLTGGTLSYTLLGAYTIYTGGKWAEKRTDNQ